MTTRYKVMCGCEYFISSLCMSSSLSTWHDFRMKHLKDRSCNAQNIRSGEISCRIFETFNKSVQRHGCHICNTAVHLAKGKQIPTPLNIMGL